jgi:acetyl-CoA acetyltransferase
VRALDAAGEAGGAERDPRRLAGPTDARLTGRSGRPRSTDRSGGLHERRRPGESAAVHHFTEGEQRMGRKVFVVGVGMTKFEKPGSKAWDYPDMAKEAGTKALADAGIAYDLVEQVTVGYCYGDSTCGQRAVYEIGLTGVPIYNVNNNCATGSTALFMAKQFVEGGLADCVMALGFEKMEKGSLGVKFQDRTNPMDKQFNVMVSIREFAPAPPAPQFFGNAGREHMDRYGTTREQFAKIGLKNHKHSVNNPYSQFQDEYTLEQILSAPMVYDPLTKLQCCPTSDGAGAAILCSEDFVKKHGLQKTAVEIAGMAMTTDFPSTFEEKSCIKLVGFDMTKKAAQKVYEQSGLGPENVQVIELHDCFSANEMVTYEALGLCPEGKAGSLIDSGAVTYGGKWVVNPSGGLISKGHPLGATGLAQCAELNWQIRGQADKRQVPGVKAALQHNLGLGGAAVVTMYRKADLA